MIDDEEPIDIETVDCEICLREVSHLDSTKEQSEHGTLFFCGLECLGLWKEQSKTELEEPHTVE